MPCQCVCVRMRQHMWSVCRSEAESMCAQCHLPVVESSGVADNHHYLPCSVLIR